MSFCSFSSQLVVENKTTIDNEFITSFMPYAPESCVKVYLYGLLACNDANEQRNTIQDFSKALAMSEQQIEEAFLYWQEQGLVLVLDTMPMQIKYLPIKNAKIKHPKIKEEKYTNFNLQVNEIINGRTPLPSEFFEYYVTMESLHIEQEAMIMIIKYCVDIKGNTVNYPYILRVAKDWANEGITTAAQVEEKLVDYKKQDEDLNLILKAMGLKRHADTQERDLYAKWLDMGFLPNLIIYVAKTQKNAQKNINFKYLDSIIEKYYTMQLFDIQSVDSYETQKDKLLLLAKTVCKNLGVYYENLEPVVENYIVKWLGYGYDEETIICISNYCFKSSIRTLEYMDKQISKFYKLGIVNVQSLNQFFDEVLLQENKIKDILSKLGLSRNVTNLDRECYRNWINYWQMSEELIDEAINQAQGKVQPIVYMNKLLGEWHKQNIKEVKQIPSAPKTSKAKLSRNYDERNYTKEELNSLFTNLDEVEI